MAMGSRKKIKDLTGQKFGLLTVVRPTEERDGGCVVWECLCDCGKTAFLNGSALKRGIIKSCGCLRRKDLTGQKFGKLTVVRATDERRGGSVVWECLCDCGETFFAREASLKSGNTKSCGCLKKEKPRKDITGQNFGMLTAVRATDELSAGSVVWECLCDCGETFFAREASLKSGNTKSCGCLRQKDLTGQKFGKLTAVRPTEERRYGGCVVWECLCDCGKTQFVAERDLKSGHTKSCGCLKRKRMRRTGE